MPPIQSASGTSATSPLTITISPTGTGNCLVVCAGATEAATNPTISGITLGGAGNFAPTRSLNSNADTDCEIWADPDCAAGQTSVAITFTGGSGGSPGYGAVVMEWSDVLLASPVDPAGNGQSAASTSWSSLPTGTLAQPSELIIGAVCFLASSTVTLTGPGAPWTDLAQVSFAASGGQAGLLAGYQIVSATGGATWSGTESGGSSPSYTAVVAALKLTAMAAPVPLLIPPGFASPMAFRRRTWPVPPLPHIFSGDTGTGADSGTGAELGNPGYPLIPPGFRSPMAWQRHSPVIPASLPTFASGDTGTGADTATIRVTGADTGTGVDAGQVSQEAETGTGTEAGTVTATVTAADSGSGADAGMIGGVMTGDTGTGTESSGTVTVRPLLMVRWKAADKLSKSGGTMA